MTRLRQKLIDELDLRGDSKHTKVSYVGVLSLLARHFNQSPDKLTDDQLKDYLLWRIRLWRSDKLTRERKRFVWNCRDEMRGVGGGEEREIS